MLHNLSLCKQHGLSYWQYTTRCLQINFYLVSIAKNIWLSDSMARPIIFRCCLFNNVFLGVIFLIVVTNAYVLLTLVAA